ncbi:MULTISPECIES: hypothetical protein [Brevundimonas]|uniref:hypothetical protein n=1 Tax=Brevundimonas TaxID=41275 RepID=UPI0025C06A68|nr:MULTISPECIES: hypothetical protein [Brevundimonas]
MTDSNANTSGLGDVGLSETYRFAYESIRNGAPGLSDATCAAIARSINMKVSLAANDRATAAEARADRLAKALERATDDLRDIGTQKPQPTNSPDPEHENYLRRVLISLGQVGNARARAALQQEKQP